MPGLGSENWVSAYPVSEKSSSRQLGEERQLQAPTLDNFSLCGHCHSRSNLVWVAEARKVASHEAHRFSCCVSVR